MNKLNVCVLFGGVSTEHEISLMTAKAIIDSLNQEKYNVFMMGITKDGRWLLYQGDTNLIPTGEWESQGKKAYISPDRTDGGIVAGDETIKIDLVYLGLHGTNGEDGAIQGLLQLAGIPYIGANLLSSALCMDKAMAKLVLKAYNVPQAEFYVVYKEMLSDMDAVVQEVENKFTYPVFVKPSNAGSSIGASKAKDRPALCDALKDALQYDYKAVVEEYVDAQEVECGILGNDKIEVGSLAQVINNSEFYDYETKYTPGMTINEIPAKISKEQTEEIKRLAKIAYMALDVTGFGRVDFFIEKGSGRILFNELNTLPGFTQFSAFPSMWKDVGVAFPDLLDRIIQYALKK